MSDMQIVVTSCSLENPRWPVTEPWMWEWSIIHGPHLDSNGQEIPGIGWKHKGYTPGQLEQAMESITKTLHQGSLPVHSKMDLRRVREAHEQYWNRERASVSLKARLHWRYAETKSQFRRLWWYWRAKPILLQRFLEVKIKIMVYDFRTKRLHQTWYFDGKNHWRKSKV